MASLIKNNPTAYILMGFCALLVVTALVLPLLPGDEIDYVAEDPGTAVPKFQQDSELPRPDELEQYALINERNLFEITRRPRTEEPDAESAAEGDEEEAVSELNAALTGVVITADQRIAMLRDNDSKEYVRASVGEGMEGAFAGWKIDEINPRDVRLSSNQGKRVKLEMEVAGTEIEKVTVKPTAFKRRRNTADKQQDQTVESRAEEIRRRIAERRAELKETAEQRAEDEGANEDNDNED